MGYISIDLGTTNIKVAVYDRSLKIQAIESETVKYIKYDNKVEFDADKYFDNIIDTVSRCMQKAISNPHMENTYSNPHMKNNFSNLHEIKQIVLTGQAESLILLDNHMRPVCNGISWLDERSTEECSILQGVFSSDLFSEITGQPAIIPTWPITKIMYLKKHEPETFGKVHKILLLKDYIQYKLTGELFGEYSIYNFSFYFDIRRKNYWQDILDYCVVFLPYLTGVNAPEFDSFAKGVFYGLRLKHDKFDLAYSIMEGVAHMLAKNAESMKKAGISQI